jgi:predicted nucleic-acid-binding protein
MQLADTIVLVRSINPQSEHHSEAKKYLSQVGVDQETFVPLVSLIEFDLVMKGRNYTHGQRSDAFHCCLHSFQKPSYYPILLHRLRWE